MIRPRRGPTTKLSLLGPRIKDHPVTVKLANVPHHFAHRDALRSERAHERVVDVHVCDKGIESWRRHLRRSPTFERAGERGRDGSRDTIVETHPDDIARPRGRI